MPPFTSPTQNPIPEPAALPQNEGIDSQTKNVILFAVIFSILAASVVGFIFLKPESKGGSATSSATSTAATTTSAEAKPVEDAKYQFSIFNFFKPRESSYSMFPTAPVSEQKTSTQSTPTGGTSPTQTTQTKTQTPAELDKTTNVPTDELVGIYQEPSSAQDQLELQFYANDLPSSPLRGKLWISSVRRSTDVKAEYIVLSTNKDLPPSTNLTGMTIKSVVSGQIVQLPEGVNVPIPNQVNSTDAIRINPNQKIIVSTGQSPLGYSFRINICTGYFEQFQNFNPGLPMSCPLLREATRPAPPNHLQDACIDYVERFPRCTIITALPKATTDVLNDEQEFRCLNFIQENTGYQKCVSENLQSANFYGTEWRVYLNRTESIWKSRREIIWLLDQQGNFISQYSY